MTQKIGKLSFCDKRLQIFIKQGDSRKGSVEKHSFCDYYILEKLNKLPFLTRMHRSVYVLEYLNVDIWF